MLLEDQYGVGDVVDVGEASGTVEAVGLRITTIRDARGVLWYIRNGEIVRVGNRSQGWARGRGRRAGRLRRRGGGHRRCCGRPPPRLADDPEFADDLLEPPEVLGVEQITVDGAVVRTTAKTAVRRRSGGSAGNCAGG